MFNLPPLDEVASSLFNALPDSVKQLEQNLQQQFKDILAASFSRLNLVTREEFDAQVKVLIRTREKIEALQAQVDALLANQKKKK